jgi:hypothetical protein
MKRQIEKWRVFLTVYKLKCKGYLPSLPQQQSLTEKGLDKKWPRNNLESEIRLENDDNLKNGLSKTNLKYF